MTTVRHVSQCSSLRYSFSFSHKCPGLVGASSRYSPTIFRRRFDGVVVYFFNSDFKFFDDASEFSVTSFCVVFIFS